MQQPVHFLLVEDDDDHAKLVERTFSNVETPLRLTRLADGASAIKYLFDDACFAKSDGPDIVLLDLNLPLMSGHDVLTQIKEDPRLRQLPVVVMTSSDADTDRARAYKSHANSYVVKPVDFVQFRKMVKDLSNYWSSWNARHAL